MNRLTDEEIAKTLWMKMHGLRSVHLPHDGRLVSFTMFAKAIAEARKGMFTDDEVKEFGKFMRDPNWKNIDADFERWLKERNGE